MKTASFNFETFSFQEFSFRKEKIDEISIEIVPSGIFNLEKNKYLLDFNFYAFDKEKGFETSFIKCKMTAVFAFMDKINSIEDIPPYFYANSIAIVFPYLRAFISSLTLQANIPPLILPTMNLRSLSEPLEKNTKFVEN